MKHLDLELEKLEQRIAPGVRAGADAPNSCGSEGAESGASKGSKDSKDSGGDGFTETSHKGLNHGRSS